MSNRRYFGTDGIRGRVGQGAMTPEFMLRLGWAVGEHLRHTAGRSKVVIGKDTRLSGYLFESAFAVEWRNYHHLLQMNYLSCHHHHSRTASFVLRQNHPETL